MAPVTSSRPEDWTWITARWITRWKPAVGFASSASPPTRFASSVSMYSVRSRLQLFEVDVAGAHDGRRVLVLDQREQEMLERGELLVALIGETKSLVQGHFERAGE